MWEEKRENKGETSFPQKKTKICRDKEKREREGNETLVIAVHLTSLTSKVFINIQKITKSKIIKPLK